MSLATLSSSEPRRQAVLDELALDEAKLGAAQGTALAAIARVLQARTRWALASLAFCDVDACWTACAADAIGPPILPPGRDFLLLALRDEGVLQIADTRLDLRFAAHAMTGEALRLPAYAGTALRVDGCAIGTLCVAHVDPGRLDAAAVESMRDLALTAEALLEARLSVARLRLYSARGRDASLAGSDWLWESNAEGHMTWVSDSAALHTGEPSEAEIGRLGRSYNAAPGEPYQASYDTYLRARAELRPYQHAIAARETPRGRLLVSMSGRPFFDAAGRFAGYRGAARDVTAEMAQRTAAQRDLLHMREAIERVTAGVMISDATGRIVMSNAQWRETIVHVMPEPPTDWPEVVRGLVHAGAYPQAAGREQEFMAWRLSLASPQGRHHELQLGHRHLLVADQRLADGSTIHLSLDVTERRAAELAVAEHETRMSAVLRSLPDQWFVLDREGLCIECNDDGPASRGQSIDALLPPSAAPAVPQALDAALRGSGMQRVEYEVVGRHGRSAQFEARLAPIGGERVLLLVRDLTELRALERDLRLMQRAFEAPGALPMMVADASLPGLPLIFVNSAFEQLSGRRRTELLGQGWRALQGDDIDQPGSAELRSAVSAGRGCLVELRQPGAGSAGWRHELHLAPIHDSEGRLTHFVGVQQDVTERRRTQRQTEINEALYRSVASAISDGLMVVNPAGIVVTVNPAACRMLETSFEALVGKSPRLLGYRLLAEDGTALAIDPVSDVLGGGPNVSDRVLMMRRPDGVEHVFCVNVNRMSTGAEAADVACVVTFFDISEQRAVEGALRDKRAAELASAAKSEFLSRMSHEMRTPLNAVIGFAQLMQMRGEAGRPVPLAKYSGHILQSGRHLLSLVNDVLDLQQVEAGQLSLVLEAVDLARALGSAWQMVEPAAHAHRVDFRIEIDADWYVLADPRRLQQVLLNLLSNAVKYNRVGGRVRCTVEPLLDATHHARRAALFVEDTGEGLSGEQLARLFQPFERLGREGSAIEGSGLGLVITRALVKEMGGSLTMSSRAGVGSRVRVELPLAPAAAASTADAAALTAAPVAADTATLRLLYVEDNVVNALLFQEVFKLLGGVELRIAPDGPDAFELVRTWQPDVLVLDAHLPSMSGYDVLRRLREMPRFASTPAFMCSADALPDELQRARDAGFSGYWSKPVDLAQVVQALGALGRPGPTRPQ